MKLRNILLNIIFILSISNAVASNYSEIKGLKGDVLKAAQMLDKNTRLTDDEKKTILEMIRHHVESFSDAPARYLLGVIYLTEGQRYQPFYQILLDEYYSTHKQKQENYYTDDIIGQNDIDDWLLNGTSYDDTNDEETYSSYISRLAFEEFSEAARMNFGPALNNLAYCYANGIGVSPDARKALELYEKAASAGEASAYANMGIQYFYGNGMAGNNFDKAFYWLDKAYKNGYKDEVALCLGYCYEKGLGTPKDMKKAVDIYESAADSAKITNALGLNVGNFSVPSRLAILYYSDKDVLDYDKAFRYLKFVADENVQEVGEVRGYILRCLSSCYRFGRGTPANEKQADFYLKKAADFGNIDAQEALEYLDIKF